MTNNKSQSVSERKQHNQRGQLEETSSFSIKVIRVLKFSFETYDFITSKGKLTLNTSVRSVAKKKDDGYSVALQIKIDTTKDEKKEGFGSYAEIVVDIKTEPSFDESYLNNATAIAFSYLRPLIAQMTVMSKMPPLDLNPLDFSELEVEIIDKEES